MTTEQQNLFARMMTPLFQAQQSTNDLFLKNRLGEEIERVIDEHIKYHVSPSEKTRNENAQALKDLDKVLQEVIYLEKGNIIQLAMAREKVLRYLYGFLRETHITRQMPIKTENTTKPAEQTPRSLISSAPVIIKSSPIKGKLTQTQESILEFVRREPECRTKDVVGQFSALSQRTIKRGLKELNEGGRIIKRSDGVAVYYSIA